jgi:DNA-directed RNA polymerase subunit alpha
MELEVERGLGYVPVEERMKEKVEIGAIALDAAFSPVRHVNYELENMRVGDRTDYNLIRFIIETDGSISPREALSRSISILVGQFRALEEEFEEGETEAKTESDGGEKREEESEEAYEETSAKMKVENLKLSSRTLNALLRGGIKNVGSLTKKTEEKLREMEGLGDKAVQEIKKALGNLGLTLKQ